MPRLESGTTLDSASATGTNRNLSVFQAHQALANFLATRREFGGPYSSAAIIVMLEVDEFRFQVDGGPEQHLVEELAPDRADQAFPERMRERDLGNCLDLGHSEHSKIGWPWMEPVQRIMIRAEVSGQGSPAQCSREHPAQRYGVDDAGVDAKAKDAASELIHQDQHPMSSQRCRLASEQVATPQAVFGVAQESEPGRPAVGFWPVVHAQDTANDILVNFNSESQCDLLRDPRTAPTRIPPFHLHNRVNQLLRRPLRAGATPPLWRKEQPILPLYKHLVEMQQGGRLQHDGRADKPCPADEKRAYPGDEAISRVQVGRALAATIQHDQLMPGQHRLGDHATDSARLREPEERDNPMRQNEPEIAPFQQS